MKIALIYDWSYPYSKGGGEIRYYNLAKKLIEMGHQVTWFTLKGWLDDKDIIINNGITYRSIGKKINAYNDSGTRSVCQSIYFGLRVLLNNNLFKEYDLIETAQFPFFHIIPLMRYRNKTVVTWFEFWGKYWFSYIKSKPVALLGFITEKLISKMPKRMITISNQSYDKLIINGRNKHNTFYISNWINYTKLSKINKNCNPYDLCYFGRLKNHKKVDIFLRAIKICNDRNMDLSVKIYGDGPERNNLEKLVEKLKLKTNVKFLGLIYKHKDLLSGVSASDLFVLPSIKEGGGSIVTLEANAVGVPIIAIKSDLGIDDSLITEGYNGYWVNSLNPYQLADKITKHLKLDYNEKYKMKINCYDFSRNFDLNFLMAKVIKVYSMV